MVGAWERGCCWRGGREPRTTFPPHQGVSPAKHSEGQHNTRWLPSREPGGWQWPWVGQALSPLAGGAPGQKVGGGAWKELTAEWKAHLGLPEPGSISGTFSLPLAHSGHRAAQGGSGCHIPPSQGRAMLPIAPRVSGFTSLLPSRSLSCSLSPLAKTSRRTIGDSPGIFTN